MRSRWERTPMTFGKPWDWRMLRNSKVSCARCYEFAESKKTKTNHLETIRCVDHEEDQVRNLADVDHRVEVIIGFDECEPPLFSTDDGDWALGFLEGLFRVTTDETLEEGSLSDPWGSNYGDDDRWWSVVGSSIDQGNMKASLVALYVPAALTVSASARLRRKCLTW
jgi:hypothetical protein